MTRYEIGDKVIRDNGTGQEMTVIQVQPKFLVCEWEEDGEIERSAFNFWEVKLVRMCDEQQEEI